MAIAWQRLDIVVLRGGSVTAPVVWPNGFGDPAEYNLLTFKALKDPLSAFAMKELVSHNVSYRKLVSPDLDHLLPEEYFRLIAVSMQYPRGLAQRIALQPRGPGAYDVQWGRIKRGRESYSPSWSRFLGRPRGRSVASRPSILAVCCCQPSAPNG